MVRSLRECFGIWPCFSVYRNGIWTASDRQCSTQRACSWGNLTRCCCFSPVGLGLPFTVLRLLTLVARKSFQCKSSMDRACCFTSLNRLRVKLIGQILSQFLTWWYCLLSRYSSILGTRWFLFSFRQELIVEVVEVGWQFAEEFGMSLHSSFWIVFLTVSRLYFSSMTLYRDMDQQSEQLRLMLNSVF